MDEFVLPQWLLATALEWRNSDELVGIALRNWLRDPTSVTPPAVGGDDE